MHEPTVLVEENSRLEDLRYLSNVSISYTEDINDVLKRFPNLQHLECMFSELSGSPTTCNWFPKLDVLTKLESLVFILFFKSAWNYLYSIGDHYESISMQVPPPSEYHFPSSLKELQLNFFPLTRASLSAIAGLPELEMLELKISYVVEGEWDARDDTFKNLKILNLTRVRFSEWQVDKETFPKLDQLILDECNKLKEIPSAFGDISSLRSIKLTHMRHDLVDSAMKIKEDVAAITGEDKLDVTAAYSSDEWYIYKYK